MSLWVSKEIRKRKLYIRMPSQTMEFPPNLLHHLDRSPTATPLCTRSASPIRGEIMPHTIAAADTTMAKLRSLMEAEQGTATASVKEHVEMSSSVDKVHNVTPVNIVDGSVNVSNLTKAGQLTIYLIFNLALTLCNKGAMSKVRRSTCFFHNQNISNLGHCSVFTLCIYTLPPVLSVLQLETLTCRESHYSV